MATAFPVQIAYGYDKSTVEEYTPGTSGNVFTIGDFVIFASGQARVAGANPAAATIIGVSEVDSELAKVLTPTGKVPVRQLTTEVVLSMSSATTPVEATHLGQEYGITKVGNNWLVDVSKTGSDARVYVSRLNVAEGIWYVKVLAEFLATDGIDG